MKRAVASTVIGQHALLLGITGGSIRSYANRIGASRVLLCQTKCDPPHFAKYELLRKLRDEGYDQVLLLDIDIYIREAAPDIFDHYSAAVFSEIPHKSPTHLQPAFAWIRDNLDPNWPATRYFNTGVMVLAAEHLDKILNAFDATVPMPGKFFEQDQLNVLMHQVGYPLQRLDERWNQFCCPKWLTDEKAARAYFLHANGVEDKMTVLTELIERYP